MKGCTLPTRSVYPTAAATYNPSTQYCVTQLGIQFFQISNDGESWKTLQEFDDNLRKKYMLRRVRPLFDGSVDLNVKKTCFRHGRIWWTQRCATTARSLHRD